MEGLLFFKSVMCLQLHLESTETLAVVSSDHDRHQQNKIALLFNMFPQLGNTAVSIAFLLFLAIVVSCIEDP